IIRVPGAQLFAQRFQRGQTAPDTDPECRQAAQKGDQERHTRCAQQVVDQYVALIDAVRGGDLVAVVVEDIDPPLPAFHFPGTVTGWQGGEIRRGNAAGAGQYLSAQCTDFTGDAFLAAD